MLPENMFVISDIRFFYVSLFGLLQNKPYQMTRSASSATREMRCAQSSSEFLVQAVKNVVGLLEQESVLFRFFFVLQLFISS